MILRFHTHAHGIMNLGKITDFERCRDRSGVEDFQNVLRLSPTDIQYPQFPPILYYGQFVAPINLFMNAALPSVRSSVMRKKHL